MINHLVSILIAVAAVEYFQAIYPQIKSQCTLDPLSEEGQIETIVPIRNGLAVVCLFSILYHVVRSFYFLGVCMYFKKYLVQG